MLAGHGAQFEQPFLDRLQAVGIEIQIACRLFEQGRALGRFDRRAVERRNGRVEPSLRAMVRRIRDDAWRHVTRLPHHVLLPTRPKPGRAPQPTVRRSAENCAGRPVPPLRPDCGSSPVSSSTAWRRKSSSRRAFSKVLGRLAARGIGVTPRGEGFGGFGPAPGQGHRAHRATRDGSPRRAAVGFRTAREFRRTPRPRRAIDRH